MADPKDELIEEETKPKAKAKPKDEAPVVEAPPGPEGDIDATFRGEVH